MPATRSGLSERQTRVTLNAAASAVVAKLFCPRPCALPYPTRRESNGKMNQEHHLSCRAKANRGPSYLNGRGAVLKERGAYVSDDFKWCLPGDAPSRAPQKSAAFNANAILGQEIVPRTDAALDEANGDVHVYNTAIFYGWKDGTTFEEPDIWTSCVVRDWARFQHRRVNGQRRNYSLHKAGLAEAELESYAPSSWARYDYSPISKRATTQLAEGNGCCLYRGSILKHLSLGLTWCETAPGGPTRCSKLRYGATMANPRWRQCGCLSCF